MIQLKEIEKTILISGTRDLIGEEQILGIIAGNMVMLPFGQLETYITKEEFVQRCWQNNSSESFRKNRLEIYDQLEATFKK